MMARKNNNKLHSQRRAENRAVLRFLLRGMVGILFVTLLGFGVWKIQDADTLPIQHIEVRSEFIKITESQIQAVLAGNELKGFFSTNVEAISNDMRKIPWLETITMRRIWPDTLQLTVTERKAIAYWNNTGLLAVDGSVFSPDAETYPQGLPSLLGPQGSEHSLLKNYITITASLQALGLHVDELKMDKRRSWTVKLNDGTTLKLGRKKINERLQRFVKIYKDFTLENKAKAEQVDLRYTNGFAIRWKQLSKQTALKAQLG